MVLLDADDAGRAQREALVWELCAGHDSGIIMLNDVLNRPGEEVEIEDVLGEALILPKRTKKLLVYLDQNFISEMAKAEGNQGSAKSFATSTRSSKQGSGMRNSSYPNHGFTTLRPTLLPA